MGHLLECVVKPDEHATTGRSPTRVKEERRPGRHVERIAVIHPRVTWGTREVPLAARFGGAIFLGAAFLAVLSTVALDGGHWRGH